MYLLVFLFGTISCERKELEGRLKMSVKKRITAAAMITLLSSSALAIPREAIQTFLTNLFKGGSSKEAVTAGRAAEGSAAGKVSEHLSVGDPTRVGNALPTIEPKPDLTADVMAEIKGDADNYRSLRIAAGKGDTSAMLKMSEMTTSGRVLDSGEPWRGYWMFRAARLGSQAAVRKARDECASGENRRAIDKWFDFACRSDYVSALHNGERSPVASAQKREILPTNSLEHLGTKQ